MKKHALFFTRALSNGIRLAYCYKIRSCLLTSEALLRGWYMLLGAENPNVSGVRSNSSSLPLGTKGDAIPSSSRVYTSPTPFLQTGFFPVLLN